MFQYFKILKVFILEILLLFKMRKDIDSDNDSSNDDDFFIDDLKDSIITIKSEGCQDKGKIIEVKENKNGVIIHYRNRWGEVNQISLYFDQVQEIKESGRTHTMDGEVSIIK